MPAPTTPFAERQGGTLRWAAEVGSRPRLIGLREYARLQTWVEQRKKELAEATRSKRRR